MSKIENNAIDKKTLYGDIANSLIFQHSSDSLLLVDWNNFDGKNKIVHINEKASQLLGYSINEIVDVEFDKLFLNPEFCQNVKQFLHLNPKTLFLHASMISKFGTHFPVEIMFEKKEDVITVLIRETEKSDRNFMDSNKNLLFNTMSQPVFLIDITGTILECNVTAAKKLGNEERATMIRKNLFDFFPQKIADYRKHKVREVIETKKAVHFIDERNGFTYNNHYYPIVNHNGMIDKIAIIADDITELHTLQKNLFLTQFSVDKSGISIIWVNEGGKITYANELAHQKFGYPQSDFLQMHIWDIYPQESKELVLATYQKIKETGSYSSEIVALRRDGSTFPTYISVNHLEIEGTSHFFAYFFDLSEKREFQWELTKLYYAIEQSPISISITDPNGIIEYVNPKYCELSGYSYEECIGKKEGFLKSGDKSKSDYAEIWNTLKSRKLWQGVFHNKNKDGSWYWEKVTISNIIDNNGELKHYLALKENVTENKILQEKLIQSQKMEALGRLAGGVAHDFNNLLTIILGYSQILESMHDNPYLSEITEIIKTTEKAASLTAQLLTFSKRQILQPKLVNINEAIQNMYSMVRRTFPSSIELHFELSDDDLPVIIDKIQFEQVILNLAFNAKEAILPKGKGKIRISTQMVTIDDEKNRKQLYAQILIADDGIGMNESTKKSIFEPFFTTKLKGTGLGLSTVYGIVSQSDGFIDINSEIGKGTTFKVHLPIKFELLGTNSIKNTELGSLSGNETVLLIEDDKDVRKILTLLLRKSGYRVIEARNGLDGLNLFTLHRKSIDLVISDLVMPEMGGVEVIDSIRIVDPSVKSIFISGYTGDQQGILAKDDIIIAKPINRLKFLETIRTVLSSASDTRFTKTDGIST